MREEGGRRGEEEEEEGWLFQMSSIIKGIEFREYILRFIPVMNTCHVEKYENLNSK